MLIVIMLSAFMWIDFGVILLCGIMHNVVLGIIIILIVKVLIFIVPGVILSNSA
jgi:hypothetical protein